MSFWKPMYVMVYREIKRFLRATSRLVGSIVNPIIWLVFFGLGWSSVFNFPMAKVIFGGLDYLSFLTPGIVLMAVFTAGFMGGISLIMDREFGFLKETLVAPAPRSSIILGRSLGTALVSLIQGAIILFLCFTIAHHLSWWGVPWALLVSFLTGLAFSGAGMAIASRMRSMEGFQLIITFLMLPIMFLSGAFFPLTNSPEWMKILAKINPLSYGVDLTRYYLTGVHQWSLSFDWTLLIVLTGVFLAAAVIVFEKTQDRSPRPISNYLYFFSNFFF